MADHRDRAHMAQAGGRSALHLHGEGVGADHACEALQPDEDVGARLWAHRGSARAADGLLPFSTSTELSAHGTATAADRGATRSQASERRRVSACLLVE